MIGVLLETLKFERLLPPLCLFFLSFSSSSAFSWGGNWVSLCSRWSPPKKAHTATYVCPQSDIHTQAPIYAPSLCTATLTGQRCSHLMALSTLTYSIRADPVSDMHGDIFLTFSAGRLPVSPPPFLLPCSGVYHGFGYIMQNLRAVTIPDNNISFC